MASDHSLSIGGDVSGSILITGDHNIIQGITHLPTDYGTRTRNFIVEYTGTPEDPVPFGGRDQVLAELDAWLNDPDACPYLLLAASAGRGKSALLVHWLERLRRRDPDLPLVFVPVSLRFNTASQAVFFAALAARLAQHLLDEALAAARKIGDEEARVAALAALLPRLTALPRPALYHLWDEMLRVLARRNPRHLLADLSALQPLILSLGGPRAIVEIFHAVQDVARWWP